MPVNHGGDFHSFFSRGVDLWQLSDDYGNGSCFFLICGGGGLRPPAVVGWLQLNPVAGELVGDGAGGAGHGGRGGVDLVDEQGQGACDGPCGGSFEGDGDRGGGGGEGCGPAAGDGLGGGGAGF